MHQLSVYYISESVIPLLCARLLSLSLFSTSRLQLFKYLFDMNERLSMVAQERDGGHGGEGDCANHDRSSPFAALVLPARTAVLPEAWLRQQLGAWLLSAWAQGL